MSDERDAGVQASGKSDSLVPIARKEYVGRDCSDSGVFVIPQLTLPRGHRHAVS